MLKFYVILHKSTGQRQNRCIQRALNGSVTAERRRANENPRGNNERTFVRILSDDFAAVDLCEEPCQTEPPEKGKSWRQKRRRKCEKTRAAKDKAAVLQAGQRKRRLSSPKTSL